VITKDTTVHLKAGPEDGLGEGQFTAYASVFGNIDSYGDIVTKGAFANDLARWEKSGNAIPVLFAHQMADPDYNIGSVIKAEEDNIGLKVTAQLDLENPKAKQVYRMLKGRRINQMSFAYDVLDGSTEKVDGQDVYEIRDLKLYEVSVVTVGANQETEILAVKQAATLADRMTQGIKAGRVLSAKNENELRSAHEAIGRVLHVLDGTTDEQKASEPDPSRQSHDDALSKSLPTLDPEVIEEEDEEEELSEEEIRAASPTPSVDFSALPDAIFGEVLAEIA
jgi:uncharacterized protein